MENILNLIASRQSNDVSQACALLSAASASEQAKLFYGAEIDSENGRLKLPFLSQISQLEADVGLLELHLLLASSDAVAVKLRNRVKALCVNGERKENALVVGSKESGCGAIFHQYFPSLEALSALPSLEDLSISEVDKLDLTGVEQISDLRTLKLHAIEEILGWKGLEHAGQLRHLDLNEVPCSAIHFTKAFRNLESLALNFYVPIGISVPWPLISGLENLKNLKVLSIGGTIESLAGIEKLTNLKTIQFSLWSDFKDISSLVALLKDRKVSFVLNTINIETYA
jgi:hypothetical protein